MYVATAGRGAAVYGRSRYCAAVGDFGSRDPVDFCIAVRDWVSGLCAASRPIPILPLSDRLVEYLHLARDVFPSEFVLGIPSASVAETLLRKDTALPIAERAGLAVPRWTLVRSHDDVSHTAGLRMPVAVRPTSWATVGQSYFKIAVYTDHHALRAGLLDMLQQRAELIVQEYVQASDEDVLFAILWRSADKTVTVACTGRKRRQSASGGGVMVWGEAADLPVVQANALRFLDVSGFTGLGGIEFISSADRQWFIEFNPRLEAIHFLAARAGIDTVLMAYQEMAMGELPVNIPKQHDAVAWVGSAGLQRLAGAPSDLRILLRDWWRFRLSSSRARAVWAWRDPCPGIAVVSRLASRGLLRVVKHFRRRLGQRR